MVPTLRASELSGPEGAPLIPEPKEPVSNRDLAVAMFTLMRDQGVVGDEVAPLVETLRAADATPGSIEHMPVEPAPGPEPIADTKRVYEVGETEAFDNGRYIQLVAVPGSDAQKWEVRDSVGTLLGYRRLYADAVALAQS
jgi:hypothetical protein